MSVQIDLISAIHDMVIVDILYKGSWRTVEPHIMGINSKGNLCIRAFQTAGGSGYSWRMFLVSDIEQVAASENVFVAREDYNSLDTSITSVVAAV